ncbi:unnamed protein product [Cylindrotheca closterium]|uniref:CCHC-type domain-containing protein n=1 Tax=Cylindrotheca closterium TaxID=2856 RepID=A0AAD2FYA5_9STRA|nr:unnamed protein product [Cylindrotheca closterium]
MADHPLTSDVIRILKSWGSEWMDVPSQRNVINKPNLLHEIEESMIAIGMFVEWLDDSSPRMESSKQAVVFVDICCGKGICSLLASYLFENDSRVSKIIMMDKPDNKLSQNGHLDWSHIVHANENAVSEQRPFIEARKENLFETDSIIKWLSTARGSDPMALVGIHLCKNLSPTFVGIANALGASQVPFLCLAPCCLPRVVVQGRNNHRNKLEVAQYEAPLQRQARLKAAQLRRNARQRHSKATRECILCQSTKHAVRQCPKLVSYSIAQQCEILERAAAMEPCWKCGQLGHRRKDCLSKQESSIPALIPQPVLHKNVSHIMGTANPFASYCQLLSTTIDRESISLFESDLEKTESSLLEHGSNWNRYRKTIYIVANDK